MDGGRQQDGAGIGRPPQDGVTLVVPREDTALVGGDQPFCGQITAEREQPVWMAQGACGVGEMIGWIIGLQHGDHAELVLNGLCASMRAA